MPDLRGASRATSRSGSAISTARASEHEEVKRGLTAGTFQHEVDHLDGTLFVDRADPRTFATWEQFDRHQRDEFVRRVARLSRRERS